jgi:hypothetical protein
MCIGLHEECPLFKSGFNETLIFSIRVPKNAQISNFMKIRPVEALLFHADGETVGPTDRKTDMMKLIVALHNFGKAPLKFSYVFTVEFPPYFLVFVPKFVIVNAATRRLPHFALPRTTSRFDKGLSLMF